MSRKYSLTETILIFAGICLLFWVLAIGQSFIVPILISLLLSLLMIPFCRWMERYFPRWLASIFSVMSIVLILTIIVYLLYLEINYISSDLTNIGLKSTQWMDATYQWIFENFGVAQTEQLVYLKEKLGMLAQEASGYLATMLGATAGFAGNLFLVVLSTFFFLYYRSFFKKFLLMLFHDPQHSRVERVLDKIKNVVQKYVVGLGIVMAIIATLNTVALLIIGVKYALFWGILAALLNIIPYIGVFIGSLLPIAYTLVTMDSLFYPIAVFLSFSGVQFLEGNFITPNVMGKSVSVNPFAAIMGLLIAGQLWGPVGMILSIPIMAILKVTFDEVETLKPFGYLLGNPEEIEQTNPKRTARWQALIIWRRRKV